MATTEFMSIQTVPKELYDELLDKYNTLLNKYEALMEVYQNELEINSLASQNTPQETMNITYTPLNTTNSIKTTPYGATLQTGWKEGFNSDFNLFESF